MMTPQEILDSKFQKAAFGGYEMAAVDDFLEKVGEDYSSLYKENAILKSKIKVLVDKVEEYRSTEDDMRAAFGAARRMSDDLVKSAQADHDKVVAEGEAQRDAMLTEAEAKSRAMVADAEAESRSIKEDAETKSRALLTEAKAYSDKITREAEVRSAGLLATAEKAAQSRISELRSLVDAEEVRLEQARARTNEYLVSARDALVKHAMSLEEIELASNAAAEAIPEPVELKIAEPEPIAAPEPVVEEPAVVEAPAAVEEPVIEAEPEPEQEPEAEAEPVEEEPEAPAEPEPVEIPLPAAEAFEPEPEPEAEAAPVEEEPEAPAEPEPAEEDAPEFEELVFENEPEAPAEEQFEISDTLAALFAEQDIKNSGKEDVLNAQIALDEIAAEVEDVEDIDDTKVWNAQDNAPRAKRRRIDLSDLKFGNNYDED